MELPALIWSLLLLLSHFSHVRLCAAPQMAKSGLSKFWLQHSLALGWLFNISVCQNEAYHSFSLGKVVRIN